MGSVAAGCPVAVWIFQPGEGSSQAVVGSVSQRQLGLVRAVNVEAVRLGVALRVAWAEAMHSITVSPRGILVPPMSTSPAGKRRMAIWLGYA